MQTIPCTVTPRAYARVAPLHSMSDLRRSAVNKMSEMRSATNVIIGALGITLCVTSLLGELLVGPLASRTLIHEWGSWCGTVRGAATSALTFGGGLFVCGAFAGSYICRQNQLAVSLAHSFARLTAVVACTCFVVALIVFPLIVRVIFHIARS